MSVDTLVKQQQDNQKTLNRIEGTLNNILKVRKKEAEAERTKTRRTRVSDRIKKSDEKKKGIIQKAKEGAAEAKGFLGGLLDNLGNLALTGGVIAVGVLVVKKIFENETVRNKIFTMIRDAVAVSWDWLKPKLREFWQTLNEEGDYAGSAGAATEQAQQTSGNTRAGYIRLAEIRDEKRKKEMELYNMLALRADLKAKADGGDAQAANALWEIETQLIPQVLGSLDTLVQSSKDLKEEFPNIKLDDTDTRIRTTEEMKVVVINSPLLGHNDVTGIPWIDGLIRTLFPTGIPQASTADLDELGEVDVTQFRQTGGPITVPGSGIGDKVLSFVQPGSFVMNKKAFQGLMEGGMPVMLEPGEGVFSPGQWGPTEMLMNSMMPRFQKGGAVINNVLPHFQKGGVLNNIIPGMQVGGVFHPHTGTGWSVGKDAQGRPAVMSQAAAESFVRMMNDSGGIVRPADIASAQRSHDHNARVGGVPGSNHLTGNAIDIHGNSKAWIKANGEKYGFRNLVYSGHDGHFDYVGKDTGAAINEPKGEGKETTAEDDKKEDKNIFQLFGDATKGAITSITTSLGLPGLGDIINTIGEGIFEGFGGVLSTFLTGGVDALFGGALNASANNLDPNKPGSEPTATNPVAPPSNAKEVYNYMQSIGLSEKHAKGLLANAIRESSLNPKAVGDGGTSFGLFQWHADRATRMKAKLGNSWTDWKKQIDYALIEPGEPGPQWRSMNFKSAQQAADWWMREWERPAHPARDSQKHADILGGLGFQQGGVVNMTNTSSRTMRRFHESSKKFEEIIASGSAPVIVPVPMGGGGGGNVGMVNTPGAGGPPAAPPTPASTSVLALLELQNRFAMGAAV